MSIVRGRFAGLLIVFVSCGKEVPDTPLSVDATVDAAAVNVVPGMEAGVLQQDGGQEAGGGSSWFVDRTGGSAVNALDHPGGSSSAFFALRASGVAVGDITGDGLPDIVAPAAFGKTLVYKNLGAFRFEDVTAASGVDGDGVANSASLCDLDGDGDLDLLIATDEARPGGTLREYKNRGDGTFVDDTAAAGFVVRGAVKSVLCTDLDGDGSLDVYVSIYGFVPAATPPDRADNFYRNAGDGTFVDVAGRLGFDTLGYTWTSAAADYDGDGRVDLYVGNDAFILDDGTRPVRPSAVVIDVDEDHLFHNDGPGPDGYPKFHALVESAAKGADAGAPDASAVIRERRSTMGIVAADVTGDGRLDYLLSNFGRKALLAGASDGTFSDRTAELGLAAIRRTDPGCDSRSTPSDCLLVTWGSAYEDFDLDGADDILMVSGQITTSTLDAQPVLFWKGGRSAAGGNVFAATETHLPSANARALVTADLDGDGDLDLVVATWNGPLTIYENTRSTPGANDAGWLAVRLKSTTSAPEGRGAIVTVGHVSKQIGTGGTVSSSAPAEARFGLGDAMSTSFDVRWPSGFVQHTGPVMANQVVTVTEPMLVTLSARIAPADGMTTVVMLVTPAKGDGTSVGAGANVTIDASAGSWQGAVEDRGDGSYRRVLVAPNAAALAVIRVSVNGKDLTAYPRVDFR